MAATYIYAIIPTGDQVIFDVGGVDDDHDEVYSIPHRDLAAVVSASPLADYRGLKRDEAVRYLVPHQRVVEVVMQAFPVLPVKFGTVLPDEAWVRRLLAQGETLFRTALERFSELVQMEVVVLWNLQEIFREIGNELRSNVQTFKRSNVTDAERIAVGQMVQASLERRRAALRDRLLPSLQEVALDVVVNPLMDDSMVTNVALLVDKAGRGALDQRLKSLDEEFEGRLHFRCVGPLPPYSFATVEVQIPSFQAVDEARRLLGLGETATPGEIKRAYHRLASQLHPDHNPNSPEAEARMAELTQAYRLLTAYADSQALFWAGEQGSTRAGVQRSRGVGAHPSTPAPQHPCTFSREAVERTLLIAIRRL
ncbi:MAG: GvpL/GvpF family gas vesicle protein [Chloroflexi bacterium]|nr:GvpL/GvpF family gas vesicle protein [Chloroflexota bacterium]